MSTIEGLHEEEFSSNIWKNRFSRLCTLYITEEYNMPGSDSDRLLCVHTCTCMLTHSTLNTSKKSKRVKKSKHCYPTLPYLYLYVPFATLPYATLHYLYYLYIYTTWRYRSDPTMSPMSQCCHCIHVHVHVCGH